MDLLRSERIFKKKTPIEISLAGKDRRAQGEKNSGKVISIKLYIRQTSYSGETVNFLDKPIADPYQPASVVRAWPKSE